MDGRSPRVGLAGPAMRHAFCTAQFARPTCLLPKDDWLPKKVIRTHHVFEYFSLSPSDMTDMLQQIRMHEHRLRQPSPFIRRIHLVQSKLQRRTTSANFLVNTHCPQNLPSLLTHPTAPIHTPGSVHSSPNTLHAHLKVSLSPPQYLNHSSWFLSIYSTTYSATFTIPPWACLSRRIWPLSNVQ